MKTMSMMHDESEVHANSRVIVRQLQVSCLSNLSEGDPDIKLCMPSRRAKSASPRHSVIEELCEFVGASTI